MHEFNPPSLTGKLSSPLPNTLLTISSNLYHRKQEYSQKSSGMREKNGPKIWLHVIPVLMCMMVRERGGQMWEMISEVIASIHVR